MHRWLEIRILCLNGATCLPSDCCFSGQIRWFPYIAPSFVERLQATLSMPLNDRGISEFQVSSNPSFQKVIYCCLSYTIFQIRFHNNYKRFETSGRIQSMGGHFTTQNTLFLCVRKLPSIDSIRPQITLNEPMWRYRAENDFGSLISTRLV
jgi:hypothetical protein